jgi:hypothetical protein
MTYLQKLLLNRKLLTVAVAVFIGALAPWALMAAEPQRGGDPCVLLA